MTDLANLAESLTPCHYALSNYVTCKTAVETARCPWATCPLERRPAILAALTVAHAAGVNAGLEMAVKWHKAEERRYQVSAGLTTHNVRVAFQAKAQAHLRSAIKCRALKSPSKENGK